MTDKLQRSDEATPEDKKEGTAIDKIGAHLDALHSRLDAIEKSLERKDAAPAEEENQAGRLEKLAEEEHEEAVEGDFSGDPDEDKDEHQEDETEEEAENGEEAEADETEEKKVEAKNYKDGDKDENKDDARHRKDAKRDDSMNALRKDVFALRKQIEGALSGKERAKFVTAQSRADKVAQAFGESAPRWLVGETLTAYRARLICKYQPHSPRWKSSDVSRIHDSATLGNIEEMVFADALATARNPTAGSGLVLREVNETDGAGRRITKFYGSPEACWGPFKAPAMRVTGFKTQFDR